MPSFYSFIKSRWKKKNETSKTENREYKSKVITSTSFSFPQKDQAAAAPANATAAAYFMFFFPPVYIRKGRFR